MSRLNLKDCRGDYVTEGSELDKVECDFEDLLDQCDSLITKLITMLLDWYSGDIYAKSTS